MRLLNYLSLAMLGAGPGITMYVNGVLNDGLWFTDSSGQTVSFLQENNLITDQGGFRLNVQGTGEGFRMVSIDENIPHYYWCEASKNPNPN